MMLGRYQTIYLWFQQKSENETFQNHIQSNLYIFYILMRLYTTSIHFSDLNL